MSSDPHKSGSPIRLAGVFGSLALVALVVWRLLTTSYMMPHTTATYVIVVLVGMLTFGAALIGHQGPFNEEASHKQEELNPQQMAELEAERVAVKLEEQRRLQS